MDYDDVANLYLKPLAEPIAEPEVPDAPARRLRDALEPIATQGWWSRQVNDRLQALGLGFFDGYVWGRAASLGEAASAVVVAAFGVFEPQFLSAVYEQGRAAARRDEVLEARAQGAAASVAAVLGSDRLDEVAAVADALLAAVGELDGCARPLFSGLRDLPVPADAFGRLWRAAELIREHRGDGHLAACVAAGLDRVTMSVLTELWLGYPLGAYTSTRGHGPDAIEKARHGLAERGWVDGVALTPVGQAARDAVESATEASQAELVRLLGDRLDSIVAVTAGWSLEFVAAGAFPPDPRKRAAG